MAFVLTVTTTSSPQTFTLPCGNAGTYNATIDWGDLGPTSAITTYNDADLAHSYAAAGTYTISITGTLPWVRFNNGGDKLLLKTIEEWGSVGVLSGNGSYYGCTNLVVNATDTPDMSSVTSMTNMFYACSAFNGDISGWDVSSVTNMSFMFRDCSAFNQSLNSWDVSSVTNMGRMFQDCSAFNQALNSWDVSSVTTMASMFHNCSAFNGDISGWDVSSVTNMSSMFYTCSAFNQSLNSWDVSAVTDMSTMFYACSAFNGDISGWTPSLVTNMSTMFRDCSAFNGDISGWDVSSVTNMTSMFQNCSLFNQNLDSWDVSAVANMSLMFISCSAFNQSLNSWDVSAVTNTSYMFQNCTALDRAFCGWDVSAVTNMTNMFSGVTLSTANYDKTLIAWEALTVQDSVTFHGGSGTFCFAATERTALINDHSWTITDGGLDGSPCVDPGVCQFPAVTDFGDESHYQGEAELTVTGTAFSDTEGEVWAYQNSNRTGLSDELSVHSWADTSLEVSIPGATNNAVGTVYLYVKRGASEWSESGYSFTLVAPCAVQPDDGYFIRCLDAASAFSLNHAFAVEDVGIDSYYVTGAQMETYFDTQYDALGSAAAVDGFVVWSDTTGLATNIATGSRILIGDATTGAAITATDSILIGQAAGQDLTSATGCIAIGTDSMAENVTGTNNTVVGYQAGKGVASNSYSDNTFVGYQAGFAVTTGSDNVAVGSGALVGVTTGEDNIALGTDSGSEVVSGADNVFLGTESGQYGDRTSSVCIGRRAGRADSDNCVAIGYQALLNNTAEYTIGIGRSTASNLTTGDGNIAIGFRALVENVTGEKNTVMGRQAGQGVAGNSNSGNTFIGYKSGSSITVGGDNVCVGAGSGDLLGPGEQNVFIGRDSGGVFTLGAGNVCIGYSVGKTAPGATTSDQLFIDNSDVDEDNVIIYGEMDNHVMKLNADVRITEPGVETADARGQLDVIQTSTTGAEPVLVLDQDDVSEEFIQFYGSASEAVLTQSFVDATDVTTATIKGYLKIDVQDEGNLITDGPYYVPFYTLA